MNTQKSKPQSETQLGSKPSGSWLPWIGLVVCTAAVCWFVVRVIVAPVYHDRQSRLYTSRLGYVAGRGVATHRFLSSCVVLRRERLPNTSLAKDSFAVNRYWSL